MDQEVGKGREIKKMTKKMQLDTGETRCKTRERTSI
jgi:hypothetical protein